MFVRKFLLFNGLFALVCRPCPLTFNSERNISYNHSLIYTFKHSNYKYEKELSKYVVIGIVAGGISYLIFTKESVSINIDETSENNPTIIKIHIMTYINLLKIPLLQ